jgi:hypothetical protein
MTADARNGMIAQAQQERMARDTVIMQKVNGAHREAFKTRFPGQVEHCMRLTAERLQALLTNKAGEMNKPETWDYTTTEVRDLCEGLYYLSLINEQYPVAEES